MSRRQRTGPAFRDYDFSWSKKENDEKKAREERYEEKKTVHNPHLNEMGEGKGCFRRNNHIYFHAGVSKESVYALHRHVLDVNDEFLYLQQTNPTIKMQPEPIFLHINSYGGGVFAAFHAIDVIKQSAIPVHTIVEGATASAGTLMSVCGEKCFIRPMASMLIHQLSSWFGGKLTEIDDEYQNLRQMHDTIKAIYREHTKLNDEELEGLLKHDLWWKADKCLEKGLVDAIWEGKSVSSSVGSRL